MTDAECVALLQWCLPRMGMRWRGFRKVRRQVRKRIERRLQALGIETPSGYRDYLEGHPEEWAVLDSFCRISISRFYRDKWVFERLGSEILPAVADAVRQRRQRRLHAWSIGCASGEEPYTLQLLWQMQLAPRFPQLDFALLATDAEEQLLRRAGEGRYPWTAVKDLPADWVDRFFEREGETYRLNQEIVRRVEFGCQDIRDEVPRDESGRPRSFHVVLCRNLAFTYFDEATQRRVLDTIAHRILPDGILVIGKSETLPEGDFGLRCWEPRVSVYRKVVQNSSLGD
jgi:chemotaxis protein methyltransferase CheR